MNKYNLRRIVTSDYDVFDTWWIKNGYPHNPEFEYLPDNGLGGFVIEKDKQIAVAYIYHTNSSIAYIDFLIANPEYKNKDRFELITILIDKCVQTAIKEGATCVWAMTNSNGIIKRCQELGYHTSKKDNCLITYQF